MSRRKSPDIHCTKPAHRPDGESALPPSGEGAAKPSAVGRLMREIQAQRTELQMQNEALSASRDETAAARKKYEQLYRQYASLFDFAPVGYLIVDRDGKIGELNLAAAIMLDAPRSVLAGRRITDFIHRDDQDGFYFQKRNCQKHMETASFELKMIKADGRFFDARSQMQTIGHRYDEEPRYCLSLMDISEHVELSSSAALQQDCLELAYRAADMEELLNRYVQRVKDYLQCDAMGIRIRDDDGNIPYQAYDGFSRDFHDSESPLSLHTDQCLCISVIKGDLDAKSPFVTPKGSIYINGTSRFMATVPVEERVPTRNICNAHGYESVALIPIVIDDTVEGLIHVADRREQRFPLRVVETLELVATRLGMAIQRFYLQEKLNESLAALNTLSCHLITVQEDEQRRIAMELHDGCGQDLNVLKLRLKGLQDRLPAGASDLSETCDHLLAYSDKIINDIRNIAHGLKPATLDVLGLAVASRHMIYEFSGYSNIEVETNIDLLGRIRNPMDQVCLYRIFQEALTNIYKHARASWVRVAANREGNKMCIVIQDNGVGFDTHKQPERADGQKGLGLSTLKLRCQMIGAKLSIHSKPGKGTRLSICLPWPQSTANP